MREITEGTSPDVKNQPDPGSLYDREVARLNAKQRHIPSDFFNQFLKIIEKKNNSIFKRFAYITLHGGPKDSNDEQIIQMCRLAFIAAVNYGEITLPKQDN